jgi:hypothetical protein
VFSKLYAIENLTRVLIHSVLNVQVGPDWWDKAVDKKTRDGAERFKARYAAKPWHGQPGGHGLYYLGLPDLNEIIRVQAHVIRHVVPEIDHLMVQLELIREPRNIVCHMNWPTKADAARVDVLLNDVEAHIGRLAKAGKVPLVVP